MATYTDNEQALIVEMVIERLGRLVVDFPEDGPARARQRVLLLRIVAKLDADDPTHPTLVRLFEQYSVIHSPRPTEPAEPADPEPVPTEMGGGAVVVSDDEEEVEEEEAEQEETAEEGTEDEEAEEGEDPLRFAFQPNVMYPSSLAMVSNHLVAVGHGYSANADGGRYYTAAGSGIRHDMNRPDPGRCFNFNCDGNHWRADCPYARGNTTIQQSNPQRDSR
jgi:hypothetical protein